ncbi:MAG: NAD-dependent epimerase/dehydratase family protein [Betaproteobacteria bacterium]|nr:NAD-dependent epimerase/dehydratase family protein [Betaproteobacteria bacterium]
MLAVVTGATGFVGRAVCARFVAAGWRVRGLARHLPAQGIVGTEFAALDLERDDPRPALEGAEIVIHLAGRAHILQDQSGDPRAAFQSANADATERLAQAMRERGIGRMVFASSAKVLGDSSPGRPFTETDAANPQDDYARSKWDAEQRLRKTLPGSTILRPPLVYGPGVGANFLRLVKLVDRGIPLPLASVRNRRSLVFVRNLADVMLTCATNPATSGATYLVSDGEDMSTPQLLRLIGEHLGRPARLWPCPPALLRFAADALGKGAEADRVLGSLELDSRSIRSSGWTPACSMVEGLRQTMAWYRRA